MLQRSICISLAASIAAMNVSWREAPVIANGNAQLFLACEQMGLNSTVESQECCRWLRAWHAWQECDQWGQDCATEVALNNIEKKLCSDQCIGFLDAQAKHANKTSGTGSVAAELSPVCAVHASSKQCPPLRIGGSDVDDFPWVAVVLCVAIGFFCSIFVFHRRCLPSYLEAKSGDQKASNPRLHVADRQLVSNLRSTATATPDNSVIVGQSGLMSQVNSGQSASVVEEEQKSKESSIIGQQSLSLPPPPIDLPVAAEVESSNSASATLPTAPKSASSLPPPPPALPPDPKIMKPVAPPPVWRASSPTNGAEAVVDDAHANTKCDVPKRISQNSNFSQKWPKGLSSLWALRRVFICTAFTGAAFRTLLLILRVCIPDMEAAPIAVELTLLVLQILWVKGPSPPETGTELPTEVMHGGPGGVLPRFGVFAVTTAVLELVSVAVTSQVSLSEACGFVPVVLNILGAPVTLTRCYSAYLALRLQDEADKLARRIAPEASVISVPATDANLGDICIDLGESPGAVGQTSPVKLLKENKKIEKEPSKQSKRCLRNCSNCSRSSMEPKKTKRPRTRAIVLAGSLIAVLSSIALALALSLTKPEDEANEELPSSCMTRQNATTTCEFYEQLGSAIGGTDPLDTCCQGCDELEGCQAWIFDSATMRCRWIRFTEQPCVATPDKVSCRCMTHPGVVFGYRPTRKIVMITR